MSFWISNPSHLQGWRRCPRVGISPLEQFPRVILKNRASYYYYYWKHRGSQIWWINTTTKNEPTSIWQLESWSSFHCLALHQWDEINSSLLNNKAFHQRWTHFLGPILAIAWIFVGTKIGNVPIYVYMGEREGHTLGFCKCVAPDWAFCSEYWPQGGEFCKIIQRTV